MAIDPLTLESSDALAPRRTRTIILSILLGLALLAIAAGLAALGIVMTLLVFNGCYGAKGVIAETLSTLWIFALFPLALAATAIVPPVLLGLGRGWRKALIAFAIGCGGSALIWIASLPLGYVWFC